MRKFILNIIDKSIDEKTGRVFFHVKTVDKKTIPLIISAYDLFNDIKMLENFSPLDVREIACAAIWHMEQIEDIIFKKNGAIFRIFNKLTRKYKEVSAIDLIHDNNTLTNLSKEDLCKVSYQLAAIAR